jgi:hypothetical protein
VGTPLPPTRSKKMPPHTPPPFADASAAVEQQSQIVDNLRRHASAATTPPDLTPSPSAPPPPDVELVDAEAALTEANSALAAARRTPNYPVNYCFSPDGCQLTHLTVQGWLKSEPDDYALSDDQVAMYNMVDRNEMFRCLRERPGFQDVVPAY